MLTFKRKQPPQVIEEPDFAHILETAFIKRCGVCWRIWPADAFIEEDGEERCPTCVDTRTTTFKADTTAEETVYAASREPEPQISQAPLASTFPGSIRKITDVNGVQVYDAAQMHLIRNVAKTLLLLGRDFSASDTITGSTGITIAVSARTPTQTTLSVTAGLTMAPGDHYSLIFNNVVFRNLFSVR